jgi:hypothetical protein
VHPCTGTEALYRPYSPYCIALTFHDHGTRKGKGQRHAPAVFNPGKDPVPVVWASGPDWTSAENLAPTGIRSSDRPAHSQLLYRLRYRGPQYQVHSHKGNYKSTDMQAGSQSVSTHVSLTYTCYCAEDKNELFGSCLWAHIPETTPTYSIKKNVLKVPTQTFVLF